MTNMGQWSGSDQTRLHLSILALGKVRLKYHHCSFIFERYLDIYGSRPGKGQIEKDEQAYSMGGLNENNIICKEPFAQYISLKTE